MQAEQKVWSNWSLRQQNHLNYPTFTEYFVITKICRSSWGAPFCGAPVRPNMLNMPKSASASFVNEYISWLILLQFTVKKFKIYLLLKIRFGYIFIVYHFPVVDLVYFVLLTYCFVLHFMLIMAALRNRAGHYIFSLWFLLLSIFPRLFSAIAD